MAIVLKVFFFSFGFVKMDLSDGKELLTIIKELIGCFENAKQTCQVYLQLNDT